MSNETYLWRMHIKTGSTSTAESPFDFCRTHGLLGVGWALYDDNERCIVPSNLEECKQLGREQYEGDRGFVTAINAFSEMQIDDLIWARQDGEYYLCRVTGDWRYEATNENLTADVVNVVPCEFVRVGTVENVPGKVVNGFRTTSSIQRVKGHSLAMDGTEINPALYMSMSLYNELTDTNYYSLEGIQQDDVLELFLPEDLEEVVSLYLQAERGYYLYSSSNKLFTQTYEFVMVHSTDYHKAVVQVKTGRITLNGNDYAHLATQNDKVYLFTACEQYENVQQSGIEAIPRSEIIRFLYGRKSLLPKRISAWLDRMPLLATP